MWHGGQSDFLQSWSWNFVSSAETASTDNIERQTHVPTQRCKNLVKKPLLLACSWSGRCSPGGCELESFTRRIHDTARFSGTLGSYFAGLGREQMPFPGHSVTARVVWCALAEGMGASGWWGHMKVGKGYQAAVLHSGLPWSCSHHSLACLHAGKHGTWMVHRAPLFSFHVK